MTAYKRTPFRGMSDEQKMRFCGGRSAYNSRRKLEAVHRRMQVAKLLRAADIGRRGWQADIARELGCHHSTISRDIAALAAIAKTCETERIDQELSQASVIADLLERSTEPESDLNLIPAQFRRPHEPR